MEPKEALALARDTLTASVNYRMAYEAYCGLMFAYAYGRQWASLGTGPSAGTAVRTLNNAIDVQNRQVRVAINEIMPRITKTCSRLRPAAMHFRAKPGSGAPNDVTGALVADELLQVHMKEIDAVGTLEEMDRWRVVLGSCVLRRTRSRNGNPVILRTPDGEPRQGPDGQPMTLGTFRHGWAETPPYEWIRDPSANSLNFRENEQILGHEKPRTTEWVRANFGKKIETLATMGGLLEFQRFLSQATRHGPTPTWQDSRQKAVMVSEWWFKDAETGRWDWHLLTYRDTMPSDRSDDARDLKVLHFGKNPYNGLPAHHFYYNVKLGSPWGMSLTSQLMPAQDIVNMSFTYFLRALVDHSCSRWVIYHDSLAGKASVDLVNKSNRPIVLKPGAPLPKREPPGQMDSGVMHTLLHSTEWLDRLMNTSPVSQGVESRRGESTETHQRRMDLADSVNTAINDRDERTIGELLVGTLYDMVPDMNMETLKAKLSGQFSDSHIYALRSQDVKNTVIGIEVVPGSLRPRTPRERQEDLAKAVEVGFVDPIEGRRTLFMETGHIIDALECREMKFQQLEIASLIRGEPPVIFDAQNHEVHMWVLSWEMSSPRFSSYDPQQQETLQAHYAQHKDLLMQTQQQEALLENPPQQGAVEPEAGPAMEFPQGVSDAMNMQPASVGAA